MDSRVVANVAIVFLVVAVLVGLFTWYFVSLNNATAECASKDAVAISTWDSWVCVKEVR